MKKTTLTLSLIALLSTSIASAQIINGDFTTGLDGWEPVSSPLPQTGSGGVILNDKMYIRQDATSAIVANKDYSLTFTGYASSSSIKLIAGIRAFDANWQGLFDQTVSITQATSSKYTIKFKAPANAAKYFVYIRRYSTSSVAGVGVVSKVVLKESNLTLKYAPPSLQNPITLNVGTGYSNPTLKADQDYIIKLPSTVKIGGLQINGGRNVVVIGGHIKLDPSVTTASSDLYRRAIYIKNNNGTVHLEGIRIEGDDATTFDGIAIASPNSIVQVQNVRIERLYGTHSGFHADMIQPFGGVKELRVDKFTGSSGYQGLQLASWSYIIGGVKLSRVNLSSRGAATKQSGGQLIWLLGSTSGFLCSQAFPISFNEVYLLPRPDGWGFGSAVYPMRSLDDVGVNCSGVQNADKTEISFPLLPSTGVIKNGVPADGDFVPEALSGLSYASPGYAE